MHAGTIVTHQRLGHKGRCLPVDMGNIVNDVFHQEEFIGLGGERVEPGTDLTLAGRAHLVVVDLHLDAHFFHQAAHRATQVVQ